MQRFFLALRPRGGDEVRLCFLGRKHMPDLGDHERAWGFVDMVTDDARKIEEKLRRDEYDTETPGTQSTAPGRRGLCR